MKTITMTQFRSEPGEHVRAVYRHGESITLTKGGKPSAKLVPAHDGITIERDGTIQGDASILAGIAILRKEAGY